MLVKASRFHALCVLLLAAGTALSLPLQILPHGPSLVRLESHLLHRGDGIVLTDLSRQPGIHSLLDTRSTPDEATTGKRMSSGPSSNATPPPRKKTLPPDNAVPASVSKHDSGHLEVQVATSHPALPGCPALVQLVSDRFFPLSLYRSPGQDSGRRSAFTPVIPANSAASNPETVSSSTDSLSQRRSSSSGRT